MSGIRVKAYSSVYSSGPEREREAGGVRCGWTDGLRGQERGGRKEGGF